MTDTTKKKSQETEARTQELKTEDLEQVRGSTGAGAGKVSMQDFHFVMRAASASTV